MHAKGIGTMALWGVVLMALGVAGCGGSQGNLRMRGAVVEDEGPRGAPLTVTLFLMSKCPFCGRSIPDLQQALELFQGDVGLHVEFVVSSEGGQLTALHGESELVGNYLLACAQKKVADRMQFVKLLSCMEETYRDIPDNYPECAKKYLTPREDAEVTACAVGREAVDLMTASAAKTREYQVRGAPTFYVGQSEYDGNRSVEDFVRVICGALGQTHPVCKERFPVD